MHSACINVKVIAIHCVRCGASVGYRRFDVDMLCVNCGQSYLARKGKHEILG